MANQKFIVIEEMGDKQKNKSFKYYYKLFFIILLIIFDFLINFNYFSVEISKYINRLRNKVNLSNELIGIYSDLFFVAKSGRASKPRFKQIKNKSYSLKKHKGILLSTIAKNENLYIREFVEYYRQLNFTKIIIFDNNDINGEIFDNILNDYIKSSYVEIIDIRGLSKIQIAVNVIKNKMNFIIYTYM